MKVNKAKQTQVIIAAYLLHALWQSSNHQDYLQQRVMEMKPVNGRFRTHHSFLRLSLSVHNAYPFYLFVPLYSVPSPYISTCTYLTFISPFSVSPICSAISFTLSSVLSFWLQSYLMPVCEAELGWIEQRNEDNEDETPVWVTGLHSKTTYTQVFDSDRVRSRFGKAFDDKPTEWEERFARLRP